MKNLKLLILAIPFFFIACNKIKEEPTPVIIPESNVKITRFAIKEFWPLSEGKIDTASKVIDIRVPAWADLEDLNAYIELAGEAETTNIGLKEIIVKDTLGGQTTYTLKFHIPEKKNISKVVSENDTILYTYNEKGFLSKLSFYEANYKDGNMVWDKRTFEAPLENGEIKLIESGGHEYIKENVTYYTDPSSATYITLDEFGRYNNNIYGREENLRFTYDIPNKRIYADFRINYAPAISIGGKDGNIFKRVIFSDFDGTYTPAALMASRASYLFSNLIFHHYRQYHEVQLIPTKSLLSNPRKVTVIENIVNDSGTDAQFEYQYETSTNTVKSLQLNSQSVTFEY